MKLLNNAKKYIIPILVVLVTGILVHILPSDDLSLDTGDIKELNTIFTIQSEDGLFTESTLPFITAGTRNESFTYQTILPEEFHSKRSLRMRSSMQNLEVYVDDQLVFSNTDFENDGPFYAPPASVWYIIHVPSHSNGSVLTIKNSSPVLKMSGRLNEIHYGSSGSLALDLFHQHPFDIILVFVFFLTGMVGMVIDLVISIDKSKRFYYMNFFLIAISIWLFSELDLMQFITGNRFLIGSISYIAIPLAAISFILFLKEATLGRYRLIINLFAVVYGMVLVLELILAVFFQVYFFEMAVYVTSYTLFVMLAVIILMVADAFHYKNGSSMKYLIFIGALLATTALQAFSFFTSDFMDLASRMIFGLFIFYVFMLADTIHYLGKVLRAQREATYLKTFVYKDVITGGWNRTKFEKDVDEHLDNPEKKPFRLVFLDMNNLKLLNDSQGHDAGDAAIKEFYHLMEAAFPSSASACCYRIGGDEFAIIMGETDADHYQARLWKFRQSLASASKNMAYPMESGIGSDVYDFTTSFGEFKEHVDQKMYRNKQSIKDPFYSKA